MQPVRSTTVVGRRAALIGLTAAPFVPRAAGASPGPELSPQEQFAMKAQDSIGGPVRKVVSPVATAVQQGIARAQNPDDGSLSPLWTAIKRCDYRGVVDALRSGADANERLGSDTPLLYVSREGHYKYPASGNESIPKALIEAGASLTARDAEGLTPFEVTMVKGFQFTAGLLLDSGADASRIHQLYREGKITCPDAKKVIADRGLMEGSQLVG